MPERKDRKRVLNDPNGDGRAAGAAWNGYVRRGLRISLRPFTRMHTLASARIDAEMPNTKGNFDDYRE